MRNQDGGRVADLVLPLIGDQFDAVIVLPPPVDVPATADPGVGGATHLVPLLVQTGPDHFVDAADLGRKAGDRLAVAVRRNRGGVDWRILDHALPVVTAVLPLLLDAVPLALGKDDRDLSIWHRLALPIHTDEIDLVGLPHGADVPLWLHTDVIGSLVDDGLGAVADLLIIDVGDGHFQREPLAGDLVGDVGLQAKGKATLLVGDPLPLGDALAVRAARLPPPTIVAVIGKAPPARPLIVKAVVGGEDDVAHPCIGHRPAEKVGRLGGDVDGISLGVLGHVGLDLHLELGLAVLGHLEAGVKVGVFVAQVVGLDGVDAQRRLLVQTELAVQRAQVADG